jgi:RNA polymerase sigma-70 factor, ECF subfamily
VIDDPTEDIRSDEQLAADYQADPAGPRGRRAAEVLLSRWRTRVYLWCFRMVREREQALDLTQETLTRAYRSLGRFDTGGSVAGWLFTIARNRCLTALRERRLRRDEGAEVDELAGLLPDPEKGVEDRDRMARVLKAMDEVLDPIERRAVWLRAHEEMSVPEITRLLGLGTASGGRGLLQTARRKLRAVLDREDVEGGERT